MPRIVTNSQEARLVNETVSAWRQGDLALQERWFIHAGDPTRALTLASETAHDGELQALTTEVEGLVMLTQTCDIIRDCVARPFVEVCPLVAVDEEQLPSIQKGQRPNLVFVPSLAAKRFVDR